MSLDINDAIAEKAVHLASTDDNDKKKRNGQLDLFPYGQHWKSAGDFRGRSVQGMYWLTWNSTRFACVPAKHCVMQKQVRTSASALNLRFKPKHVMQRQQWNEVVHIYAVLLVFTATGSSQQRSMRRQVSRYRWLLHAMRADITADLLPLRAVLSQQHNLNAVANYERVHLLRL